MPGRSCLILAVQKRHKLPPDEGGPQGVDGIEATRRLPRQRVLILTPFGLDRHIIEAFTRR